ncbi:MAG: hypothetical protein LDL41_02830 [Coleofasciculus sp. S288]|nr:hypothetical protein [Coleofasciculus sp. S288]
MKPLLMLLLLSLTGGAVFAGQAVFQSQSEDGAALAYDHCIRTHINQQGGLTPELVSMCKGVER